jgi:beta-galactosidase
VQLAEVTKTANGARVVVRAQYDRPGATNQRFGGGIALKVASNGSIDVSYNFKPTNTEGQLLEVGLSMIAPESATEFRWLGAGPFAGYPGKDALNEFGLHHLTSGDLRFQGNRREVDLALLTSKAGAGVLLGGTNMDVAVENVAGGILFNHNARVSGRGNKGGAPESSIKGSSLNPIAGQFTLLPLSKEWPATLNCWFGSTSGKPELQKPFYRSYDQ